MVIFIDVFLTLEGVNMKWIYLFIIIFSCVSIYSCEFNLLEEAQVLPPNPLDLTEDSIK